MENSNRIYFLDNLRVFIILLVIILHCAISYVTPPFPGWVHNIQLNPVFWLICVPLQSSVLMPAMFFIAGYFMVPSLLKKGRVKFIKDKLIRLGIPYIFGIIILAPIIEHMAAISSGKNENIMSRFLMFFNKQYFNQYHFWFLGVLLFLFFIVFCLSYIFSNKFNHTESISSSPSPILILIFFVITFILRFTVDIFLNITDFSSQWVRLYFLQFEKTGVPLHITYFILGIYANRKKWFDNSYKSIIYPWILLYVFTSIANIYLLVFVFPGYSSSSIIRKFTLDFVICVETLSFLFMLLSIFHRFLNKDGMLLRRISKSSFIVYLIHLNILFIILFFTKDLALTLFLKFILQLIATITISWILGFILKKIPGFNKFL